MSDKPETVDLAYIGRLVAAFEATTTSLSERAAFVGDAYPIRTAYIDGFNL